MDFLKLLIPNIHKEGIIFVLIALFTAVLLSFISSKLTVIAIVGCIFVVFFFRDPTRVTTVGENFITSPADGLVTKIEEVSLPSSLGFEESDKALRISIFLNVFDVHVNRIPADGTITKTYYHQGKFFNASLDKASVYNERQEILMEMNNGKQLVFTQIAGLIARRIVCNVDEGQKVKAGERFGIIRFGSRMDVYVPLGTKLQVFEGNYVRGGETILADLNQKEERTGEIR
jgi:phosphatidylserine decarboxylase